MQLRPPSRGPVQDREADDEDVRSPRTMRCRGHRCLIGAALVLLCLCGAWRLGPARLPLMLTSDVPNPSQTAPGPLAGTADIARLTGQLQPPSEHEAELARVRREADARVSAAREEARRAKAELVEAGKVYQAKLAEAAENMPARAKEAPTDAAAKAAEEEAARKAAEDTELARVRREADARVSAAREERVGSGNGTIIAGLRQRVHELEAQLEAHRGVGNLDGPIGKVARYVERGERCGTVGHDGKLSMCRAKTCCNQHGWCGNTKEHCALPENSTLESEIARWASKVLADELLPEESDKTKWQAFDEIPPKTSKTLREYGYAPCSFMLLPTDTRYPRTRPGTGGIGETPASKPTKPKKTKKEPKKPKKPKTKKEPRGRSAPGHMLACVRRLATWQERGDIVFRLMEGQALGAQMVGGYHGGSDDDDLDMKMVSRKGDDYETHYTWCGAKAKGKSPAGSKLGSFGFTALEESEDNKAAFLAQSQGRGKIVPDSCIGTWEGIELLLLKPENPYVRQQHGGSYWVPPVQGGKKLGVRLRAYMDPADELFDYFASWLVRFHEGLKNGVDTDSNMQISVAEFMAYVRNNDRVNQKWLAQADPCDVANGFVHYHFMMPTIQLARELRKKCDGMVNATTCHDRNWVEFKAAFGSGPNYLKSRSECLALINVDENRH